MGQVPTLARRRDLPVLSGASTSAGAPSMVNRLLSLPSPAMDTAKYWTTGPATAVDGLLVVPRFHCGPRSRRPRPSTCPRAVESGGVTAIG